MCHDRTVGPIALEDRGACAHGGILLLVAYGPHAFDRGRALPTNRFCRTSRALPSFHSRPKLRRQTAPVESSLSQDPDFEGF